MEFALFDCTAMDANGRTSEALTARERGLCVDQQQALVETTAPSTIGGVPIASPPPPVGLALGWDNPLFLVAMLGAAGAAIWKAMEYLPRYDSARRQQLQGSLPGSPYTQPRLANAGGRMPASQDIQADTAPEYSPKENVHTAANTGLYGVVQGREIGISEPSPWMATEAQRAAYQEDRTVVVEVESPQAFLRRCTVQEFQAKIPAGALDPVAVLESHVGEPMAQEQCAYWFRMGIAEVGKVGWAVFGCNGQGGSSRARATSTLVKRIRDHFQAKCTIEGEQ